MKKSLILLLCALTATMGKQFLLTGTVRDFWPVNSWAAKCGSQNATTPCKKSSPDFENVVADDRGIVTNHIGTDRKPVFNPQYTGSTVHSKATFDTWFRNSADYNVAYPLTLTLEESKDQPGVYYYGNSDFYVMDNKGFGNFYNGHNYHYCAEFHSMFTYRGGEVFKFMGDDDVFVYMNDVLVVDLGGVHPAETVYVDLNTTARTTNMTPGQTYAIDIFFCERHTVASNFFMTTSLDLRCPAGKEDVCGVCFGDGSSCRPKPSTYSTSSTTRPSTTSSTNRPSTTSSTYSTSSTTSQIPTTSPCGAGELFCPDKNSCYFPSQYTCDVDPITHNKTLCAMGTSACNSVCIADCAYHCNADGTIGVDDVNTCALVTVCPTGQIACGSACYDPTAMCCISGKPSLLSNCATSNPPINTSPCALTLDNVGTLEDGQLRLRSGPGAMNVSFTLTTGILKDNRGQTCYIASNNQLQCNTQPQTTNYNQFGLNDQFLAFAGNFVWFSCAVGTGGANLYTAKVDSTCSPLQLAVIKAC